MNESQTLQPGHILHETYRIESVLGQGGFGITYLAFDLTLERYVAIKEFFPKDFCDRDSDTSHVTLGTQSNYEFIENLKKKFLKEARNIARLNHANIIRIISSFEQNGTAYYAMDFIEGESLQEKVKRNGAIPLSQALEYITKVGSALEYIHSLNINHLDVKPANVMVRRLDNNPLLIDFGLAKQYDAAGNQTSTTPTGISHGFAPVEQYQADGVAEFSPQTDIYSLGATLYYLLTATVPPEAISVMENGLDFPPGLPPYIESAIRIAMNPGRKKRPASVSEWIAMLSTPAPCDKTEIANTHSNSTPPPPPIPPANYPQPNQPLNPPPLNWRQYQGQQPGYTPANYEPSKKNNTIWIILGILGALSIIAIVIFAIWDSGSSAYETTSGYDEPYVYEETVAVDSEVWVEAEVATDTPCAADVYPEYEENYEDWGQDAAAEPASAEDGYYYDPNPK